MRERSRSIRRVAAVADTHEDDTSPWPPRSEPPPSTEPPSTEPPVGVPPVAPLDSPVVPTGAEPAPAPVPPTPAPASSAPPGTTGWIPPTTAKPGARPRSGGWDGARIAGIILVLVGVFLLLRRFVPLDSELLLPVVAIVIGGALVLGALRPRGRNG